MYIDDIEETAISYCNVSTFIITSKMLNAILVVWLCNDIAMKYKHEKELILFWNLFKKLQ